MNWEFCRSAAALARVESTRALRTVVFGLVALHSSVAPGQEAPWVFDGCVVGVRWLPAETASEWWSRITVEISNVYPQRHTCQRGGTLGGCTAWSWYSYQDWWINASQVEMEITPPSGAKILLGRSLEYRPSETGPTDFHWWITNKRTGVRVVEGRYTWEVPCTHVRSTEIFRDGFETGNTINWLSLEINR